MFLFIVKLITAILFLLLGICNTYNEYFLSAGMNFACTIMWGIMTYWEWRDR